MVLAGTGRAYGAAGSATGPGWSTTLDDAGIPIPEAAPTWAHDVGNGDAPSGRNDEFAWRAHAEPGLRRKGTARAWAGTGQRIRALALTGALLGTFALGWFGGATSHRLFEPVASAPKPHQHAPVRSEPRASAEPRDQGKSSGAVRKLSSAPAYRPELTTMSVPDVERSLARPMPVPETRPATIGGWTVREVVGSTAVLEGPDGVWRVARGDIVPALGRVDSIVRWGSYWLVSTTRGLVATE
jgi:hypothetical protein